MNTFQNFNRCRAATAAMDISGVGLYDRSSILQIDSS
jgi:hypothetical protein